MSKLDLIFNELSLLAPSLCREPDRVKEWMTNFIGVLRRFWEIQKSEPQVWKEFCFRSFVSWFDVDFTESFSFRDWLQSTSQIERDFFLSIETKVPALHPEREREEFSRFYDIEAFFEEKKADGLCAAFIFKGVAVSLQTSSAWEARQLSIRLEKITEAGSFQNDERHVFHACLEAHVEDLLPRLRELALPPPQDGRGLLARRQDYFPTLVFGPSCIEQLEREGSGKRFQQIFERLEGLARYAQERENGVFDIHSHRLRNASDESESTKNDPELSRRRRFSSSSGESFMCFFHLKLGDGRRIHFCPFPGDQRIFVGYIGPHLPT